MKLIKLENGYYNLESENKVIGTTYEFSSDVGDVIPYKRLSKQNCDEIFGVIDVDNLVDKFVEGLDISEKVKHAIQFGYQEGLIKAMELNKDKLFTVEDMKKAIYIAWEDDNLSSTDIIQSLQQPTEIEVEIVTHIDLAATPVDSRHPDAYLGTDTGIPFLDENDCLILKKK
jgi:hypothetical protein